METGESMAGGSQYALPRLSLKDHMFRRGIHLVSGIVVIYYLFPERFFFFPRQFWLVICLGLIPMFMEYLRLKKGVLFLGQRPHEQKTVGAYAWSLWGSTAIMLILPQNVAVPVILIYQFADPIISVLRAWKKWSVFPVGFLSIWIMLLVFGFDPVLAGIAAITMMIGESTELKGVLRIRPEIIKLYNVKEHTDTWTFKFKSDDDGTTQLVPAFLLGLVYLLYPSAFPGPWLYPLI